MQNRDPGLRFPWRRLQTVGFSPNKAQTPQAEARATNPRNFLYDVASMFRRKRFRLRLRSRALILGERTLIMGVLNITPDSFSDGGEYLDSEAAIARALQLEQDGADILDVGGESTRPGSTPIQAGEELRRILPVIEILRGKLRIPISVDTQKADVAKAALDAGAE